MPKRSRLAPRSRRPCRSFRSGITPCTSMYAWLGTKVSKERRGGTCPSQQRYGQRSCPGQPSQGDGERSYERDRHDDGDHDKTGGCCPQQRDSASRKGPAHHDGSGSHPEEPGEGRGSSQEQRKGKSRQTERQWRNQKDEGDEARGSRADTLERRAP